MTIESRIENQVEILKIQGTLNAQNVADVKSYIEKILGGNIRLAVLDLENLDEIDSSGIGAIVSLLKRMRMQKRDVRIFRLRGTVKKLFELLRIDKSMEVFEDLDKAMAY
jgi:anti-sigma B factor antagonist